MSKSEFWQDGAKAKDVMREASLHRGLIERWEKHAKEIADLEDLAGLCEKDGDSEVEQDLASAAGQDGREIEAMEIEALMKGEDDEKDAILTIHPGAGGTESQDWAQMLMRMYVQVGGAQGVRGRGDGRGARRRRPASRAPPSR